MSVDNIERFFLDKRGINLRVTQNYKGSFNISIDVGVLDTPTLGSVDLMIKELIMGYPPLKADLERIGKMDKEMEDYRTFFRLLRGAHK